MSIIKLSTEDIKRAANEINTETANIDNALSEFSKACGQIEGGYTGDSGQETLQAAIASKVKLTQINEELKELVKLINKHADKIQSIQTELRNTSKSIEESFN